MISGLHGTVQRLGLDHARIRVGPFDLKVALPLSALNTLPPLGSPVDLVTYLYRREDVLARYGFTTDEDLALFQQLLLVQGIGPRLALGLLSVLPAAELRRTIASGDEVALTRIPGVGKRTAGRPTDSGDRLHRVGWGFPRPQAEQVLALPEIAASADPGARLAAAAARLMQRS